MTGKSGVVYYPFGLAFNQYQRENSLDNKFKFQSQEHIDDLGLNWDSFMWRNHQPDIGRFFNVDPLAEKYFYNSPYAFSENKVVAHVELEGLESATAGKPEEKKPEQQQQQSGAANALAYVAQWLSSLGSTYNAWAGNKDASESENLMTGATVVGTVMTAPAEHFVALGEGGEAAGEAAAVSKLDDAKPVINQADNVVSLGARAKQIHGAVSARTQGSTTIAVADATGPNGPIRIVGSSEARLRPAQRAMLGPNEVAATGPGHAEVTVLNYAAQNNYNVTNIGASRGICPSCTFSILNYGATAVTPLKPVKIPLKPK